MIPAQQIVFLDTSIQIARIIPSPLSVTTIEAHLANPSIAPVTSSYVWMEYQRTVIADYAHVYNVMGRYAKWGDLFAHILMARMAFVRGQQYVVSKLLDNSTTQVSMIMLWPAIKSARNYPMGCGTSSGAILQPYLIRFSATL